MSRWENGKEPIGPTSEKLIRILIGLDLVTNQGNLVTFDTWESSVARLTDTYGDVAAWGSRYPHHDASAPDEAIANLRKWNAPDDVVARYMGGNAATHFGS